MAVLLLVPRLDPLTPLHCSRTDASWPPGSLMLLLTSSSVFQGLCSELRKNTEELMVQRMNSEALEFPLVVGGQRNG